MLTVLMATHNGTDTLARTLSSLAMLTAPAGGWKLVVVNNASTDLTEEVVLGFKGKLPLTYVTEPKLGKNRALNTGLAHVEGDVIIFTDDDVIPDSDWLAQWRSGVDRHPDFAIFGGTITPLFEAPPPPWLARTNCMTPLFSATRSQEGESNPHHIFGPNMGVRASVVDQGIRFDERRLIGPSGLLGDETAFLVELEKSGHRAFFLADARVQHIVGRHQITWRWMLKRFVRFGRRAFFEEQAAKMEKCPQIFKVPRFLYRRIGTEILLLPMIALHLDVGRIFSHLQMLAYDWGQVKQAREMAKTRP